MEFRSPVCDDVIINETIRIMKHSIHQTSCWWLAKMYNYTYETYKYVHIKHCHNRSCREVLFSFNRCTVCVIWDKKWCSFLLNQMWLLNPLQATKTKQKNSTLEYYFNFLIGKLNRGNSVFPGYVFLNKNLHLLIEYSMI